MSSAEGTPRREVAHRIFAREYEDATLEQSDSDDDRAPKYVITPTGASINRLFVVGVLTEVETVGDGVLRARIVDPTGAFVVYAGQYQPEAANFLERTDPPEYVAVTGKARTFQPEDSDEIYSSLRPEAINSVTAETRDHWTVQTAEQTLDRVAAMAQARTRSERGDALADVLETAGYPTTLARGIPLAIAHYDTRSRYLAAIQELALQALAVVTGDRDAVDGIDVTPESTGEAEVEPITSGWLDISFEEADWPAADSGSAADRSESETAEITAESSTVRDPPEPEPGEAVDDAAPQSVSTAESESRDEDADSTGEQLGDFEEYSAEAETTDERYELDESERREVEETYGTDFTTGNEVDDPGEADIETPSAESEPAGDSDAEPAATGDQDPDSSETSTDTVDDEPVEDEEELELDEAVIEIMRRLDDGDGADREAVITESADEFDTDTASVESAIQDALMDGRCYEPEDGKLTAI